jgi:hypothetical protein
MHILKADIRWSTKANISLVTTYGTQKKRGTSFRSNARDMDRSSDEISLTSAVGSGDLHRFGTTLIRIFLKSKRSWATIR